MNVDEDQFSHMVTMLLEKGLGRLWSTCCI